MKSLEFFKPTLATTLAIVLAWLLFVRPARAGYIVTLRQVGPDVVATGSGAIDLTGLNFLSSDDGPEPGIEPSASFLPFGANASIVTGPTPTTMVDSYLSSADRSGPAIFGGGSYTSASSGSGDMVGIFREPRYNWDTVIVPAGYVSGAALSDSATYSGASLVTLGVTPGTYVWKWGTGANQNFTLQIKTPVPASTAIWYLNNNAFVAGSSAPTLPVGWIVVNVVDLNGDRQPDYLLYNAITHQTAIWYLNNNVFVGAAFGPTLPAKWKVVGVADFNGDVGADYLLFNSTSHQTAIWYLSGTTFVSGAFGPSIPSGWDLVAVGDFKGDGKPDYVLYNAVTHQTAIWYLNNNVFVSAAFGPTVPANWKVVGVVADFNHGGEADYLLYNTSTRQTAIWYLSGPTLIGGAYAPTIASGYTLIGAADFNADGKPDYVLYGPSVQGTTR
jgi:elongation factor P hydroxylase